MAGLPITVDGRVRMGAVLALVAVPPLSIGSARALALVRGGGGRPSARWPLAAGRRCTQPPGRVDVAVSPRAVDPGHPPAARPAPRRAAQGRGSTVRTRT